MGNSHFSALFTEKHGYSHAKAIMQVLSFHLSPVDLISLSRTCKNLNKITPKYIMFRLKQNLIPLVADIFKYSLETAAEFVDQVSEDVYFFGSTLVLALISVDTSADTSTNTAKPSTRAFDVSDLDMICVLDNHAPKPIIVQKGHVYKFKIKKNDDGTEKHVGLVEKFSLGREQQGFRQPLRNICNCLDEKSSPILVKQHAKSHQQSMMYFPGENCTTLKMRKFVSHPYLRQWFAKMKMEARELYRPETSGFFQQSTHISVASPETKFGENPTCDIVFLQLEDNKTKPHQFAWDHILTSPFRMGQVCLGMKDSKLSLSIKNLEMLQKRICVIEPGSGLPIYTGLKTTKSKKRPKQKTNQSKKLDINMFQYFMKYVDRSICDIHFQFDLDHDNSIQNMRSVRSWCKNEDWESPLEVKRNFVRIPEKDGITTIVIKR